MNGRDPLSHAIIGAAIDVHRELGPGLLESAYAHCLALELSSRGLYHRREVTIPIIYKGRTLDVSYRADLIVEERILVEVKSVQRLDPVHHAQLMTYLRLTRLHLGLLLNFNSAVLKEGIVRIVL